MNTKHKGIPLALLFSAIFASMIILTSTALADSKHITFSEPVTVGSVVLEAGTYNVVWVGTGPEVQVSFKKRNKTLATTSARLVFEKSQHRRMVRTTRLPDNSRILEQISFSEETLIFDLPSLEPREIA